MEHVFIELLNMSITASWLVLAIIVFRFLFKKAPKALTVALWALVGIRLICPVSLESVLSLIPSNETIPQDIVYTENPTIHTGFESLNSTINPIISDTFAPNVGDSVNPMQVIVFIASNVWALGMICMMLYTFISYWSIHRKVRESVRIRDNVWMCDRIDTPFILGVFRPQIYLPSNMGEQDVRYVLAHEEAHIKRHDHWWKPIGFALLTVYWFNPILWIAYVLLCRDIELACDEKVIKEMGEDMKKSYSDALINCSVPRKAITACPLAFGEVGVKERIKSVLNYKKPAFWVISIAVVVSVLIAVCFMTNPAKEAEYSVLLKIDYEVPSGEVFEEDCFYAYDEKGYSYRIYWNNFIGLSENGMILVKYDQIKSLSYPDGYPSGRTPRYEIVAVSVIPLIISDFETSDRDISISVGTSQYTNVDLGPVELSLTDAHTIRHFLEVPQSSGTEQYSVWMQGAIRIMYDFIFTFEDKIYSYSSTEGMFNDYELDRALYLSDEDKKRVDDIITKYLYDSNTPDSKIIKWINCWEDPDVDWGSTYEMILPGISNVKFQWKEGDISVIDDNGTKELIGGMGASCMNAYFCDLTGDGVSELCATVSVGSGWVDERIWVYDYTVDKIYELEDRWNYSYILSIWGDELVVSKVKANTREPIIEQGALHLSKNNLTGEMELSYWFNASSENNPNTEEFTLSSGVYLGGIKPEDADPTSGELMGQYFHLETETQMFRMGESLLMSFALFGTYEFDGTKLILTTGSNNPEIYVFYLNEKGSFVYNESESNVTQHKWIKDGMAFGLMPEERGSSSPDT